MRVAVLSAGGQGLLFLCIGGLFNKDPSFMRPDLLLLGVRIDIHNNRIASGAGESNQEELAPVFTFGDRSAEAFTPVVVVALVVNLLFRCL